MKDVIKAEGAFVEHKNTSERSRIFCDEIGYMHDRKKFGGNTIFDHHLMFWLKGKLVFKVWLRNNPEDKEYKNIYKALEHVGIKVIK